MPQPVAESTLVLCWWITLGIGAVVIGVVALLLRSLAREAERIDACAAEIWRVGKRIAGNTIHIPILARINQVAVEILQAAGGIARAAERLRGAAGGGERG